MPEEKVSLEQMAKNIDALQKVGATMFVDKSVAGNNERTRFLPPAADAGPRQCEHKGKFGERCLDCSARYYNDEWYSSGKVPDDAPVPQEAAPPEPYRIDHTTVLDFEAEIEYIKEIDRKVTAPDWAMRVAERICRDCFRAGDTSQANHIAALIREAGSEREIALERVLRILLNEALLNWHCKPEDNCHECSAIQPTLAEASRMLGGESK